MLIRSCPSLNADGVTGPLSKICFKEVVECGTTAGLSSSSISELSDSSVTASGSL